jgi:hypothetical protein
MLMGVPFPALLMLVQRHMPDAVPWVWGINGFASVVASVLTAIIALSWGFVAVFLVAAAAYLVVWALSLRIERVSLSLA